MCFPTRCESFSTAPPNEPSDADIAWAAGLFEGEGCFYVGNPKGPDGKRRARPQMNISMCDEDVLVRFKAIVGGGHLLKLKYRKSEAHRPLWKWQTQSRGEIARIGELFRPWLGVRRLKRFDEVLMMARQENDPRTCTYCGSSFVPLRFRTSANVFCSKICNSRHHFGIKVPRYGNPPKEA